MRLFGQWSSARIFRFQSTHPSGVRLDQYNSSMDKIDISIHAPQWGATCGGTTRYAEHVISIHAPQWGATWLWPTRRRFLMNFNPRTPVGCDKMVHTGLSTSRYFNPRTPVGCDRTRSRQNLRRQDFNPRTPVGCDQYRCYNMEQARDFNPRTPVGCDLIFVFGVQTL